MFISIAQVPDQTILEDRRSPLLPKCQTKQSWKIDAHLCYSSVRPSYFTHMELNLIVLIPRSRKETLTLIKYINKNTIIV